MGISGLWSKVKENPFLCIPVTVKSDIQNTIFLVDGNALAFYLFRSMSQEITKVYYGGEYLNYKQVVSDYIKRLIKVSNNNVVIFLDGSTPKSKIKTSIQRVIRTQRAYDNIRYNNI